MKIKKVAAILLVILLCFALVGCGASINENNQVVAKRVVNACTSYLAGDIGVETLLALVDKEVDNVDSEQTKGNKDGKYFQLVLSTFTLKLPCLLYTSPSPRD